MPVFHTFSSGTFMSNDRNFNLDQGFVVKISLCLSDGLNIIQKPLYSENIYDFKVYNKIVWFIISK